MRSKKNKERTPFRPLVTLEQMLAQTWTAVRQWLRFSQADIKLLAGAGQTATMSDYSAGKTENLN